MGTRAAWAVWAGVKSVRFFRGGYGSEIERANRGERTYAQYFVRNEESASPARNDISERVECSFEIFVRVNSQSDPAIQSLIKRTKEALGAAERLLRETRFTNLKRS
jgi:hypothetical protein